MNKTKTITIIAMMTALSFIFYFFEFSIGLIFPAAAFLKMDFSDVPVIITTLKLNPISGIVVALLKNIMHITISKDPALTGEIANFAYCFMFIIPFFYKKRKTNNLVYIFLISIIFSTIAMCFVNYYITLPLYGIVEKNELLLSVFVPFNLLKGCLISVISFFVNCKLVTR